MSGPMVTDHAVLRFLERAGGCDVEAIRTLIQSSMARAHAAARAMGDTDYLLKIGGLTFVVRGETVTTVVETGDGAKEGYTLRDGGRRQ